MKLQPGGIQHGDDFTISIRMHAHIILEYRNSASQEHLPVLRHVPSKRNPRKLFSAVQVEAASTCCSWRAFCRIKYIAIALERKALLPRGERKVRPGPGVAPDITRQWQASKRIRIGKTDGPEVHRVTQTSNVSSKGRVSEQIWIHDLLTKFLTRPPLRWS